MKTLQVALKQRSCVWDFSEDGGAISSFNTGLVLPANCMVHEIMVEVVNTVTDSGGGLAVLNMGYNGTLDWFFGIGVTSPLLRAGSYNVGATGLRQSVCTGNEILFSISGEALTTGLVKFHFLFVQSFL